MLALERSGLPGALMQGAIHGTVSASNPDGRRRGAGRPEANAANVTEEWIRVLFSCGYCPRPANEPSGLRSVQEIFGQFFECVGVQNLPPPHQIAIDVTKLGLITDFAP